MTLTLPAGHEVTASEATQLTDVANALGDALIDFSATFTITAPTTNPTKGNSAYVVKYCVVGKMMYYTVFITIGSTFSAGSGSYKFLTPLPVDISVSNILATKIVDSGTIIRSGFTEPVDSTHLSTTLDSAGSVLSNTGPGTAWATGDQIQFSGWLRLA